MSKANGVGMFRIAVMLFVFQAVLNSCENKQIVNQCQYDSIIYELPEKANQYIVQNILNKDEVLYCSISSDMEKNEYTYSFPYKARTTLGNKRQILIKKTNRFLKINERYIPILFGEDEMFSNEKEDSIATTQCFNFGFIKVNGLGEVVDGFSY